MQLFWTLTNLATIVLAGTAYLFLAAMTATSFDRTAAWLGARKWRLLHLVGGWYIWISFAVAIGKRLPLRADLLADGRLGAGRRHRAAYRDDAAQSPSDRAQRVRLASRTLNRGSPGDRTIWSAICTRTFLRSSIQFLPGPVNSSLARPAGSVLGPRVRGKAKAWRISRSS